MERRWSCLLRVAVVLARRVTWPEVKVVGSSDWLLGQLGEGAVFGPERWRCQARLIQETG